MGDKATCPVCDSHTSDIYHSFERKEKCPVCLISFETVESINRIRAEKIKLKRLNIEKNIIDENESLKEKLVFSGEHNRLAEDKLSHILVSLQDLLQELEVYKDG